MPAKKTTTKKEDMKKNMCKNHDSCSATGGGFYLLGFLGAAIYYISTTMGFWAGLLGVLKAMVWPAFLVHGLLKLIGA